MPLYNIVMLFSHTNPKMHARVDPSRTRMFGPIEATWGGAVKLPDEGEWGALEEFGGREWMMPHSMFAVKLEDIATLQDLINKAVKAESESVS